MRVLIGCVAENNAKFLAQALRLVLSVRWFGGRLAKADVMVGVVDGTDAGYAAELAGLGALVRRMDRVDPRFAPGNKLNLFLQPEVDDYDLVFYLDCDTVVVQDPTPYLSPDKLQAKMADAPTVPLATFARLCQHFGLTLPEASYRTTIAGTPTIWYCNSGVLNMPVRLINEIVPLWRHYQTQLSTQPHLFAEQQFCGQAGLALAYLTHPVPFAEWSVALNYPLHFGDHPTPPALLAADPVILHYHNQVDASGALLPAPYPTAQARIEQFNARLREHMGTGWHFPAVPAVPAAKPTATRMGEQAAITGTLLIEAGQDIARLRQRLEPLREHPQGQLRAVLIGAGDFKPAAAALLADLRLSLPYVAFEVGSVTAAVEQVLRHVATPRIGFLAAEAGYAAPRWDAVPETGQALLPWLPDVPLPAASMRGPVELALGWLAPASFLQSLAQTANLADWALWKLADEGLNGCPLAWLAAPATHPLVGAAPARNPRRALTATSSVLAVVAHYNCEAFLAQCLDGLVHQTRPPDGIVVVDDGSDVSPAEIVRQYPGVTLLTPPHNAGLYRVLQAVIDTTRYDAYLIQDADDWPALNRLELSLAEAERTGAELVGSQEVRLLCKQRQVAPMALPLDVNLASQLMPVGLPLLLGTSLISRALLRRISGYATGFRIVADTELIQRAVYTGRVVDLPYYAYYRRKRPGSMTTSPASEETAPARLAEKKIANDGILHNKALVESGLPPRLHPPRLAAHVPLTHHFGPRLSLAPGVPSDDTTAPAPVCVTGMHRSGTSMVARLLNLCGLHLGPDQDLPAPGPDNPEGYWENSRFVRLNEALLDQWHGAWDLPPEPTLLMEDAVEQQAAATELIQTLSIQPWWGWKDPRTSLTLPFWQALVPGLRVVICVRHPLEVAASLHQRGASSLAFALRLWETYYTRLLDAAPPERRLITHYESYFVDAAAETRRVLAALDARVPEDVVERAAATALPRLRHQFWPDESVPARVSELYARLCAEAGPVYQLSRTMPRSLPDVAGLPPTENPAEAVAADPTSERAIERETIEHLQASLAARDHHLTALLHRVEVAEHEVEALQRAKIVRAAYAYWTLRARLLQAASGLKQMARRVLAPTPRPPAPVDEAAPNGSDPQAGTLP